MASFCPIVYVRGFANGQAAIDAAADDPLQGFNLGSTHVRVGDGGVPQFFQFEGPVLRLIADHGYAVPVFGNQRAYLESRVDGSEDPRTIWVHRYYDASASTFGAVAQPFVIEGAARDLYALVQLVLRKTGAPRVHLVAHSMGGLVCRSMMQKVVPEATGNPGGAADIVDRLFTYATPHNGIHYAIGNGLVEQLRDLIDFDASAIFGPARMYQYLTPLPPGAPLPVTAPADWQPAAVPPDCFPAERIFCLVGTDASDYVGDSNPFGQLLGPQSDGAVQIHDAAVPGAPRALVHRSHSGRYGIVNSEEGYHNLRRFLFGDLQVQVDLEGLSIPADPNGGRIWQLDVRLAVRGVPALMDEQTVAHHCPIQLPIGTADPATVPLVTTFLDSTLGRASGHGAHTLRYSLSLTVHALDQHPNGTLDVSAQLAQTGDFTDSLIVDYQPATARHAPRAWAEWNSKIPGAVGDRLPHDGAALAVVEAVPDTWRSEVPFPETAAPMLGADARLAITVTHRT
jgi:hypothetical protein